MIQDLKGKAVLVTGASTGIGAAVAEAFAEHGARVAIHYNRSAEAAEAVADRARAAGAEAVTLQADLTDRAAAAALVPRAVEALGRLDVLINNAGDVLERRPFAEADDAYMASVIDLNVWPVLIASREAVRQFRAQGGGGNIITTSSVAARMGGGPGAALYGSSKAFVSNLTRALAKELASEGIRVNAVGPGIILTPLHERRTAPEALQAMLRNIPMNRGASAAECAGAYLYLASDALSGYVTGQTLEVNGGQLMP